MIIFINMKQVTFKNILPFKKKCLMISVKKTIACILICFHGITHANNDEILQGILLAGIAVTGIVVAGKITYELTSQYQKEVEKNCIAAQALLLKTDKYTQINIDHSSYKTQEKSLEYIHRQLRTGNNTDSLTIHLEREVQELQAVQTKFLSIYSPNKEITNLQKEISLRLNICLSLLAVIEQHASYFKLYDMHNTYREMPTYQSKVIEWIIMQSGNSLYPILDYKEKAARDITYIDNCNISAYPDLTNKIQSTKKEIQRSLALVYASDKATIEIQNKKQNEMQLAEIQAIEHKNSIALRGVKAQEQVARDQAEIAANTRSIRELERKKVEEISRQNHLLAIRYPIDQENNRLQAEKNRLQAEKNRLLSEQNQINLLIAENRRREIAALEVQNQLQLERNQREQERRNPSRVYTQANVVPSAPPVENESTNIPLARPYSGGNLPQATVVYPKK